MNFFEHQRQARRSTRLLIALFALAVIATSALIGGLVWLLNVKMGEGMPPTVAFWKGFYWAKVTFMLIVLASLWRIWQLRQGGYRVAQEMGAVPVSDDTRDPLLKRLYNVTEEVAIASRVPMPRLYLLEKESSLNAFAAGYSPNDSAVIVTRGLLERLNRDELQAVIAHEFSHIQNGDMRLNIRLIGLVYGILLISVLGQRFLLVASKFKVSGKDATAIAVAQLMLMLAACCVIAIGYVGVLFARLIKAAISRQREFLADASAVQFTRQKKGLAGALKKIAGLEQGSHLANKAVAEEVSHMLFSQGYKLTHWFATHPPVLERIRRLDTSFRLENLAPLRANWALNPPNGFAEDQALGLARADESIGVPPPLPPLRQAPQPPPLPPVEPVEKHLPPGGDVLGQHLYQPVSPIPEALYTLAHDQHHAPFLLLALLIDKHADAISRNQYAAIAAQLGKESECRVREIVQKPLQHGALSQRLPLAIMAFPLLRGFSSEKQHAFSQCIDAVSHANGHISLFSYCLSRLLQTQLHSVQQPRQRLFGKRKVVQLKEPVDSLLSVVAWAGHVEDDNAARQAWQASWHHLFPADNRHYSAPTSVLALDAVWQPLDCLDALGKELLVEALMVCVRHNHVIDLAEADLLRTVCGILHCPLPEQLQMGHEQPLENH